MLNNGLEKMNGLVNHYQKKNTNIGNLEKMNTGEFSQIRCIHYFTLYPKCLQKVISL